MKRREWLSIASAGTGLVLVGGFAPVFAGARPKAFAFIPSDEKSHSIEKKLADSMSGVDVTVFGRAKDLERSVRQASPEAVIAPEPTLRDLGLSPTLEGKRAGSTTEPYVLVTVDRPMSPRSMAAHTVGILGIMGHTAMKKHCGSLLGTGEQKIKTVTKYADLLPLLQFRAAQGVVLPKRFVSTLTSRSALELVSNDLPQGRVGLVSVTISSAGARATLVSALEGLSGSAKEVIGVENWQ